MREDRLIRQVIFWGILFALACVVLASVSCKDIPAYELRAYRNGVVARGYITAIDIYGHTDAWNGHKTYYVLTFDNGMKIELHPWELHSKPHSNPSQGMVAVGVYAEVYYDWGCGYIIVIKNR